MGKPVYLDHNASSPMCREVTAAVAEMMGYAGNASSVHGFGRLHRQRVEEAREEVAALAGVQADRVVFTSGGTEANNLALKASGRKTVLTSSIEHDSVLRAVEGSKSLPIDRDGIVDITQIPDALNAEAEPVLLSIMLANNETGVIQPVAEVAAIAATQGAIVHTDAVQAAGRIEFDVARLGVAMATLSAHKIGGPQGIGALVLTENFPFAAQIRGGGQERGRRAGTENTAGIVGFGVAARLARGRLATIASISTLRDGLETRLRKAIPEAIVFGDAATRLPNTSCFAVPGLRSETQVLALDLAGVAVSAGSACSSGKVTPSHVLRAMKVPEALAGCAIRVSLGEGNKMADIERLIAAIVALRDRTASRSADAA
jgi:cysteine desulfurase